MSKIIYKLCVFLKIPLLCCGGCRKYCCEFSQGRIVHTLFFLEEVEQMMIVFHYTSIIAAYVCVTLAAMHFDKPSLLWWYIIPMLTMLIGISEKSSNNKKGE